MAGQLSFTKYLQSVVATVGEPANFVCHIQSAGSSSTPQITWYKDGSELSASNDRFSMTSDGDRYSLSIIKTDKSDAGEYKITVVNETSRLSCSASLLVVEPGQAEMIVVKSQSEDRSPGGEMTVVKTTKMSSTKSSTSQPAGDSSEEQVVIKTTKVTEKASTQETTVGGLGFTKYMESCVSKIGETGTFECNIHSDGDAPEVTWFKDGVQLSGSDKISMKSKGEKYTLTISNAQESDSGEYKITASSSGGHLSCTASLLVTDETVVIVRQEVEEVTESESEEESEESSEE